MPRSFALGERFEAFIDQQVKSGRYNNASEVVRDGLRILEDLELVRQKRVVEIRRLLAEAEGDDLIPADQVFDELRRRYKAMAADDAGEPWPLPFSSLEWPSLTSGRSATSSPATTPGGQCRSWMNSRRGAGGSPTFPRRRRSAPSIATGSEVSSIGPT
jgi:antitoxin ParD1/3/4